LESMLRRGHRLGTAKIIAKAASVRAMFEARSFGLPSAYYPPDRNRVT
jgi:hypothetical protein